MEKFVQKQNLTPSSPHLTIRQGRLYKLYPIGIYLLKVNNRNTRTMREICSKLTIKIPEWRQWRFLVSLLLTLNRFHTLFWCFYCWLKTSNCRLGKSLSNISKKFQAKTLLKIFADWLKKSPNTPDNNDDDDELFFWYG